MGIQANRAADSRPASNQAPSVELLADLLVVGRDLVAEVKGLRAHLAQSRDLPCQPDDSRFLAAVAASVRGCVFSIAELRAHALVDLDLQRAIGALGNQQLGKRLRDLAGRDVGGFVVTRVTRDESGVVWAVSVTSDLHADAGLSAETGA